MEQRVAGFLKCVASWKFGVTVSPTGQTVHSRMFGPNCGEDRRHSIFHSPARTPAKFYGASTGTKSYGASTSYGADQIGSCCLCSQASSASSFIFVPMFQWYDDIMILILIFSQVFPPKGHKFHKPNQILLYSSQNFQISIFDIQFDIMIMICNDI